MTTTISTAVGPDNIPGILLVIICTLEPFVAAAFLIWCCDRVPETAGQGYNAAAAGTRSRTTSGSPARVMEPQQLAHFVPRRHRGGWRKRTARASVVVCAICLEALVGGAECSEVPACRHVFHRGCLALWMKSSSTCLLCRLQEACRAGVVTTTLCCRGHGLA
ncbi:hypothetical protein ZWY2020_045490 [Hordeum vulgare]|nr:hypothetical protein ZWY2020_045490 [Hordeum vulgare]